MMSSWRPKIQTVPPAQRIDQVSHFERVPLPQNHDILFFNIIFLRLHYIIFIIVITLKMMNYELILRFFFFFLDCFYSILLFSRGKGHHIVRHYSCSHFIHLSDLFLKQIGSVIAPTTHAHTPRSSWTPQLQAHSLPFLGLSSSHAAWDPQHRPPRCLVYPAKKRREFVHWMYDIEEG